MLALAHLVSKAVTTKPYLVRQIATTSVRNGKFFADAEDKRENFFISIFIYELYIRYKVLLFIEI